MKKGLIIEIKTENPEIGTFIKVKESKITLVHAGKDLLQKYRKIIEEMPQKVPQRDEALQLIDLYLKSEYV